MKLHLLILGGCVDSSSEGLDLKNKEKWNSIAPISNKGNRWRNRGKEKHLLLDVKLVSKWYASLQKLTADSENR